MELQKEFLDMIQSDINRIEESVKQGTDEQRWELFREMDGKYQGCIKDFYEGMWLSIPGPQLAEYPDYVLDNLKIVKAKLETYRFKGKAIALPENARTQVNVTTNVNVSVTFDQARSQVNDMTSLTEEQTQEVLEKISEIEKVVRGSESKKTKWETIKSVLVWLGDKSFDVGMTLLPLLLQLK